MHRAILIIGHEATGDSQEKKQKLAWGNGPSTKTALMLVELILKCFAAVVRPGWHCKEPRRGSHMPRASCWKDRNILDLISVRDVKLRPFIPSLHAQSDHRMLHVS